MDQDKGEVPDGLQAVGVHQESVISGGEPVAVGEGVVGQGGRRERGGGLDGEVLHTDHGSNLLAELYPGSVLDGHVSIGDQLQALARGGLVAVLVHRQRGRSHWSHSYLQQSNYVN